MISVLSKQTQTFLRKKFWNSYLLFGLYCKKFGPQMIKETFDYINEFEIKYIVNITNNHIIDFRIQLIREANL